MLLIVAGPLLISEMFAQIPGASYISRVSVHSPKQVRRARKAIKRAFEYQLEGRGFSMIEVLSTCPTGWGLSPIEALKWLDENMIPYYPLGVYKSLGGRLDDISKIDLCRLWWTRGDVTWSAPDLCRNARRKRGLLDAFIRPGDEGRYCFLLCQYFR